MPSAGYSHRSLAAKLGLAPGMRALLLDAPPGYLAALGEVVAQVELCDTSATDGTDESALDFIQVFALDAATLAARLSPLAAALAPRGMLWVCWPKQAAKLAATLTAQVSTDVTEAGVRAAGLAVGLVDVKVAAIDATWSGLKFVRRLRDRS